MQISKNRYLPAYLFDPHFSLNAKPQLVFLTLPLIKSFIKFMTGVLYFRSPVSWKISNCKRIEQTFKVKITNARRVHRFRKGFK